MLVLYMVRDSYNSLAMKCPYCGVEGFFFLFGGAWRGGGLGFGFAMSGGGGIIPR